MVAAELVNLRLPPSNIPASAAFQRSYTTSLAWYVATTADSSTRALYTANAVEQAAESVS